MLIRWTCSASNPTFDYKPGNAPLGSLRLATKAEFLDDKNVRCKIPKAWEYPLKCTCQCNANPNNLCGSKQERTNLTSYEFPASSPWSPAARTEPIYYIQSVTHMIDSVDVCTPDESSVNFCNPEDQLAKCNEPAARPSQPDRWDIDGGITEGAGCQVRVQVGVNLQQLSLETTPVHYVYDIRMPEVTRIFPTSGPLVGGTVLTIEGLRFPPTDDDVEYITPRCVFGPTLYTEAERISSTQLTCTSPRACAWNIYGGGGGVAIYGREDEVASGPPAPGTPCHFPFVWPPPGLKESVYAGGATKAKGGKPQTTCVLPPKEGDDDYEAAVEFFGSEAAIPGVLAHKGLYGLILTTSARGCIRIAKRRAQQKRPPARIHAYAHAHARMNEHAHMNEHMRAHTQPQHSVLPPQTSPRTSSGACAHVT